ncbi:putative cysteine-rich receptor-like protein kinase 9 [Coffea eugenioides]|uniref:putative cysteine-rich receptor-like protein kinase 9 n=1 Tax=Coffea eugenioides TaxID=49369 RepID=UPI000F610528|nr:putative cysteine-rich receptor-like protein kinase 9 [Coffea eugenioides]
MIYRSVLFSCFPLICLISFNTGLIYADYWCVNPNTTAGRRYTDNLNFLLSTLSSNASLASRNGFYNFTAGHDPSNMVYGLFNCRGDVNPDGCGRCVANAREDILKTCWNQTTVFMLYDECLLRYSNESMFPWTDQGIIFYRVNTQNATDPDKFNQVLSHMMNDIASQTANARSGKKFAIKEEDYSPFQRRLYALGQCTPDLSSLDCENCLRSAISQIPTYCNNRQGCRVALFSCNIRYELYKFYNSISPAPEPALSHPPTPPPPLPPSNSTSSEAIEPHLVVNSYIHQVLTWIV